ncbi:MAG TPA: 50S ribosomal protein L24 [Candidatus Acidoferrales bacterium]
MRPQEETRIPTLIRKGDQVRVMRGRDRGKTGRVLSVNAIDRTVTVEHAQMQKKHTKPNPQKNIKGGILEREGPIAISNVMLVCPSCGKPARLGNKIEFHTVRRKRADGVEVESQERRLLGRICKRCQALVSS